VKKYGRTEQAIDDKVIWRMGFFMSGNQALNNHSEYVLRISFHGSNV